MQSLSKPDKKRANGTSSQAGSRKTWAKNTALEKIKAVKRKFSKSLLFRRDESPFTNPDMIKCFIDGSVSAPNRYMKTRNVGIRHPSDVPGLQQLLNRHWKTGLWSRGDSTTTSEDNSPRLKFKRKPRTKDKRARTPKTKENLGGKPLVSMPSTPPPSNSDDSGLPHSEGVTIHIPEDGNGDIPLTESQLLEELENTSPESLAMEEEVQAAQRIAPHDGQNEPLPQRPPKCRGVKRRSKSPRPQLVPEQTEGSASYESNRLLIDEVDCSLDAREPSPLHHSTPLLSCEEEITNSDDNTDKQANNLFTANSSGVLPQKSVNDPRPVAAVSARKRYGDEDVHVLGVTPAPPPRTTRARTTVEEEVALQPAELIIPRKRTSSDMGKFSPHPHTVNIILGEEDIGSLSNLYTSAGYTVATGYEGITMNKLSKYFNLQQEQRELVRMVILYMGAREMYTLTTAGDQPQVDGRKGPVASAFKKLIQATLRLFCNARIVFIPAWINPHKSGEGDYPLLPEVEKVFRNMCCHVATEFNMPGAPKKVSIITAKRPNTAYGPHHERRQITVQASTALGLRIRRVLEGKVDLDEAT